MTTPLSPPAPAAATPTPAPTRTRRIAAEEHEAALEAYFRRCVRVQLGGMYIKLLPGIVKGIPDRLVVLHGGILKLVELKAIGGRLSPRQVLVHEQLAARGVHVDVVTGRAGIDAWVQAQYPTTRELDRSARARRQTKK